MHLVEIPASGLVHFEIRKVLQQRQKRRGVEFAKVSYKFDDDEENAPVDGTNKMLVSQADGEHFGQPLLRLFADQ